MATVPAIPNSDRYIDATATAGQTSFNVSWPVIADSELLAEDDLVIRINGSTLLSSAFSFTGITVTGLAGFWSGGTVTLNAACAGGERVIIYSARAPRRTGNFLEGKTLQFSELDKLQDDIVIMTRDLAFAQKRTPMITIENYLSGEDPNNLQADINTAVGLVNAGVAIVQAAAGSLSGDVMFARPVTQLIAAPTGAEANGVRYIVLNGTGTFAGKNNLVAEKVSGVWVFSSTPKQGQKVYVVNVQQEYCYRNTWWNQLKAGMDIYQHFADVPSGTLANGITLATGQSLVIQGGGAAGGVCQNSRFEPTDNSYLCVNFPAKNLLMGMSGAWRAGHSGIGGMTLAAGTYVAGAIISKMVHSEFLEQTRPGISIWGGPRQTDLGGGPLGYLANDQLQFITYQTDTNYPLHTTGNTTACEMVISGNTARCYSEKMRFQNGYNDDMISGSCGDDDTGANLGYLYFQTGGAVSAFNPYVYEIYAKALPAPAEIVPDPKTIPSSAGLPIAKSKALAFGATAEVCRFTPTDFTDYTFEVDAHISTQGVVIGYAQAARKWIIQVTKYAGTIILGTPLAVYAEQASAFNPATITLSNVLTITTSGSDVILQGTPSRTGADATTYSPLVYYTIRALASGAPFT